MKKLQVLAFIAMLAIPSIEALADNGVATNMPSQNKELFKAIKSGDSVAVKQIVSDNPSLVNSTDKNGYTPLHNASYRGSKQVVDQLLSQGADVNATHSKHGSTPLHSAASKKCNAGVVKSLLDKGADQTKVDSYGKTPLEYASQCKKKQKHNKNSN